MTSNPMCNCRQHYGDEHNAGSQVYSSGPSWTLKGRLVDAERSRSPGPVYDTAQGHSYLEKVCTPQTSWSLSHSKCNVYVTHTLEPYPKHGHNAKQHMLHQD